MKGRGGGVSLSPMLDKQSPPPAKKRASEGRLVLLLTFSSAALQAVEKRSTVGVYCGFSEQMLEFLL